MPGLVDDVRVKLATTDYFYRLYQANGIDYMLRPPPAALTIMLKDEETAAIAKITQALATV